MSHYEKISTALAIIALVISLVSFFISTASSAKTVKLSQGINELEVKNMINATKQRVEDITLQMLPLASKAQRTEEEKTQLEGYRAVLNSAIENNVNAYEEACAKYVDKKIDRRRFRKTYNLEIRQLVTDVNHARLFDAVKSPYKAILKVYDEWENLER